MFRDAISREDFSKCVLLCVSNEPQDYLPHKVAEVCPSALLKPASFEALHSQSRKIADSALGSHLSAVLKAPFRTIHLHRL